MRKTRHTLLLFSMSMVLSTLVISSAYATVVEQCGGGTIDANAEDGIDFSSGCGEINSIIGTISGDIKLSGTAELYINDNITTITGKIDISGDAVLHLASGVTISDLQNDFLIYDNGAANIGGTISAQKKMELSDNAYVTMDNGTFDSSNGDILIKEGTTLDMQNASSIKVPGGKKIEIKSTGSLLSDGTGNSIDGPINDEPGSNIPLFLQYCTGSPCVEAPGFIIIETGGSNEVAEGGANDSFNVFLIFEPSSNVVLDLSTNDVTEFIISPTSLTFTPSNFMDQQTVTITPVEDVVNDNEIVTTATISINDALSANEYDPVADQNPTVTVFDNEYFNPTAQDFSKTTDEDTEVFVAYADLSYSDPDGQAMDQLEVVTAPAKGTLFRDTSPFGTFDGTDIVLGNGSTLTYNQINSGRLGFLPDANEIGAPYTTFTYRVYDEATTYSSGSDFSNTQTVTIDVNSLNDPPAFSTSGDVSVLEDFAAQQTVTVTPDPVPTDEASQTVTYSLSPSSVTFATIGFDTNSGEVTIDAIADENGSQVFTITADDAQGVNNIAIDNFTLTVTVVNDAPSFTKGGDQTISEDAGIQTVLTWATSLNAGPGNESGQTFSFNVGNDNSGLFAVQPAINSTGDLTYTPADDKNGVATVTVSISDSGGTLNGGVDTSPDQTFTITINAQNDDPIISAIADQFTSENTAITGIPFTVDEGGESDEDAQVLTVTATSSNQTIVPDANITVNYSDNAGASADALSPTLDITPASDQNGTVTITVTVTDDGAGTPSVMETFDLSINAPSTRGPGGVSDQLSYWFKADGGVNTTGSLIDSWDDQSANGASATSTGTNRASLTTSNASINNQPSITFDGNDYLTFAHSASDTEDRTYGVVLSIDNATTDRDAIIFESERITVGYRGSGESDPNLFYDRIGGAGSYPTTQFFTGSWLIHQKTVAIAGTIGFYFNGSIVPETTTHTPQSESSTTTYLGDVSGTNRGFNGELGEVYKFGKVLNHAEKTVIDNYLSAKYDATLDASDYYAGDDPANGNFDFDVIGVGTSTDETVPGSHTSSSGYHGLSIDAISGFDDDDYVFLGHDGTTNGLNTSDLGGLSNTHSRWERIWYIDKTDASTALAVDLTFDFSDAGLSTAPTTASNYKLIYRSGQTGNWSVAATAASITGDQLTFSNITLSDGDGYYTIGQTQSFILSTTTGTTNESGTTSQFTLVLAEQPLTNVFFGVSSGDTGEGTVDKSSLTFTNANWNVPQAVTVTGVDDAVIDGDITYDITISIMDASSDDSFDELPDQTVSITNEDNDVFSNSDNLIINPSAEFDPTTYGWTYVSGNWVNGTEIPAQHGNFHFYAGSASGTVEIFQDIDVSNYSALIDAGQVEFAFSGYMNSYQNLDAAQIIVEYRDATSGVLTSYNTGLQIHTAWTLYCDKTIAPANTRSIRIRLKSKRNAGVDNDGYIDNLVLRAVTVTNGFTICPAVVYAEEGGNTSFELVLNSAPSSNVTIDLTSLDPAAASLGVTSVSFDNTNWSIPQTIIVTGVQDADSDNETVEITAIVNDAVSDNSFDGLSQNVQAIIDDDEVGFTVSDISGNTKENGTGANFSVVLNNQPATNVVFDVTSSNTGEGTVDKSTLTFTNSNWGIPQSVIVTGVDESLIDGDQPYNILVSVNDGASDNLFDPLADQTVNVINEDDDVAGFTIVESEGSTFTTEDGTMDSFSVVLDAQPTGSVTINISNIDATEISLDLTTLTFTNANWNSAQTVTVTGLDDAIDDNGTTIELIFSVDPSSDGGFTGLPNKSITLINEDNDPPGITITPTAGLVVNESGTTASFLVVLQSEPTADVTFNLYSSDVGEGTVSPTTFVFDATNWNTGRNFTITGVNDDLIDGNVDFMIITSPLISADTHNGIDPADISVTNEDDDVASFTVSPISGNTHESGTTATFTVVLDAQPLTDVVFNVTSMDTGEGTVNKSILTFTDSDWNNPQTVTVTGKDEPLLDGDITYNITVSVNDAASDNAFDPLPDQTVSVTNEDNEVAGFSTSVVSGITNESGTTDTLAVVLNVQPLTDVVFSVISNDTGEGTLDLSTLTFTNSNWGVSQEVIISGVDDSLVDGDISFDINVSIDDASSDDGFDALADQTVGITNEDDDVAGFTLSTTSITLSEDGSNTFTIVLDAEPAADVLIDVSTTATEISLDVPQITLDAANWDTGEMVTITAGETGSQSDLSRTILAEVNASSDPDFTAVADQNLNVTVNPVNDKPVITAQVALSTDEDTDLTITLTNLTVTDPDNTYPADFTLTVSTGTNYTVTGTTITPATDFNGTLTVPVTVNDGTIDSDPFNLSVNVNVVNDPPSITLPADQTVNEDDEITDIAFFVDEGGGTDEDVQTLTVSVTSSDQSIVPDANISLDYGDNGTASASLESPVIDITPLPEAFGVVTITITVQDNGSGNNTAVGTFDLNVRPVNDQPTFTPGPDVVVDEDFGSYTAQWATDLNKGQPNESAQTLTFLVTNDDNSLFEVQPYMNSDGVLFFTTKDHAFGQANIDVFMYDDGGVLYQGVNTSDTEGFKITINEINDVPTGADQGINVAASSTYIFAESDFNDQYADVEGDSFDGIRIVERSGVTAGTLTYDLAAIPGDNFDISANNISKLRYNSDAATDTYNFTFKVQDDNGAFSDDTYAMYLVVGTPNLPTGAAITRVIDEDEAYDFTSAEFQAVYSHPDALPFDGIKITILETTGTLKLNGTDVTLNQVIKKTNLSNLTFTPAENENGASYDSFGFTVLDASNSESAASYTYTFNVTPLNDAPVFEIEGDQFAYDEDGAQTVTGFMTGQDDGDPELTQNLSIQVTNTKNELFDVQPAIDVTTGDLTYTPADKANGLAIVTVTLSDDGGTPNGGVDGSVLTFKLTIMDGISTTPTTIPSGSYIVDMGNPTGLEDGLLPYGLVFDLTSNYEVPVSIAINENKAKDGIDFSHEGVDYKGAPFIISEEFITPEIASVIASWEDNGSKVGGAGKPGIEGNFTTTDALNVPIYVTFTSYPTWTLDTENAAIAINYFDLAGIPSSAYKTAYPYELDQTDDIFVMPHADPTWDDHSNLYYWNQSFDNGGQGGWIWAGCHAVSVLENLSNPLDSTEKMNFLSDPALLHYQTDGHDSGSEPYSYRYPGHQFMQFVGTYDGATNNGSEQIYLPKLNGGWRASTQVAVYDPDHSDIPANSPGEAAKMVFGPAFGDPENGMVLYQGGHSLDAGTDLEKAAAIRAFLNFSFLAPLSKVPVTISFFVPDEMGQGSSYSLLIDAEGRDGLTPSYEWSTSCGGTFDDNTSATPMYTPPAVGSPTACLISVKITDSFGRQSFETHNVNILATTAPTFSTFTTPVKTGNEDVELEITFAELLAASDASDADGTVQDFIVQTLLNGTLNIGTDAGSATPFVAGANDLVDATNNLYWTPPADEFGTLDFIEATVQDDLGANSTDLVTGQITLNAVNDVPSFIKGNNQTILEDAGAQTVNSWATSISVGPANESSQMVSFNVSNDNNALFSAQPAVDASGNLTYTPAADANGVASLTVSISDDGGGTDTSADQTFDITVNIVAAYIVSVISNNTDESGTTATFTVVLDSQPPTDVVFDIISGDTSEGTVDLPTLTFTNGNWNSAQTVTVTGIDEDLVDGDITYDVTVSVDASSDDAFDPLAAQTVTVTNEDDDVAGFTTSAISGNTNESGTTATFTVVLDTQPLTNVVFDVISGDTGEGTVDLSTLTFTNGNWNTAQTVTVTGIDEDLVDGDITYDVTVSVDASSDDAFDPLAAQTVTVTNEDDDIAGFTLSTTTVSTAEGSTTSFTILLKAEPNSNVTIDVSSDDIGAASLDLASVSFDNLNWNVAQTITVTGEQDDDLNDETPITITATVNDAASDDNFDALADQTVTATITDDDTAGFTLSTTTVSTAEGSTTNFTIVLDAAPNSNVTIDVSSDDAGAASVDLANVSFNNTNWNVAQTITVTGEQDDDLNDETPITITATVNDAASDDNFDALADQTVTATITDDDTAGFTLSTTTVSTAEGSTTSFTIVLDASPNSNVTIDVSSDDAAAASVDLASVSFDNTNWNVAQTITVTGEQDDDLNDETATITATINDAASDDNYDPLADQTVTATVTDDDTAGFTLSTTTVSIAEGSTTNFTIVLDAQPNSNVTIDVSSDDAGAASLDLANVSFDNLNWNVAQTITVTGEQDDDLNNETATITTTINDAASDDNFDALADQTVTATVTDDDTAGFTLSTTTVSTAEGSTTNFTIVLDAAPNSNVTIDVSSDDAAAASVDLASVSFDNLNWNVAQTITVTGEQDDDLNNESATITTTINDTASDDNFDPLVDQTVTATVTDDDTAGFTLSTTTVSTAEGSTTNFTIVLDAAPNSNVTIDVSSDDDGAASVDLASVSFDNTNWNVAQTITVTGEQDDDLNNESATITTTINDTASDDNFDPLVDQTVTATVTDDDTAGFTLSTTTVSTVEGSTTNFTIVLDAAPNSNVTIDVSSDDAAAASLDLASVSFDNSNWNVAQTITVTGEQDDDLNDETATITATINDAASDDNFDPLADQTVVASVTDDDTAGFTLSTTTVSTAEGSTTNFTIVLDAAPNSNVTIDVSSDDAGAASLDLASVSFDNSNWNVAQTITVTGEQDDDLNDETATITATINDTASDDNFDPLVDQTVTATVTDDDTAGFTLSTTTVSTVEGSTTNFTIVLDAAPNSNVTIDVSSDDAAAASVDLASVSFDNLNWNVAQTITVTGEQDDDLNDESATITATVNDAASDDNYDPLTDQTVTATVTDDDTAGVTLSTTTVSTVEGSTTSFTIVLDAAPNSNVTIDVSSDDAGAASLDLASVSFDNSNWNVAQTITVTGEQDDDLNDETPITITTTVNDAASDDNFDPLVDQTVTATITDDDTAGVTLSTTTVNTVEGSTTNFTIVLDAAPNSNVTIDVSSDDAGAASVDLASVSFDNLNWNVAQTITVTGEQDDDLNDESATITATVNDAASDDNFDALADQTVVTSVTDDDTAGVTLSTTTVSIAEGSTTNFTIVLDAAPNSNVTIDVSSDDAAAASLNLASVSFDNSNWNVAQTITITGEQDNDLNDESATITATVNDAASDDIFDALADQTVTATITDDDTAGVTLSTTTVSTAEGSTTNFTIVLDAAPNSNVTIDVSSDDTGAARVDLASVSFDNTNWNVAQTITITGEQDDDLNDESATITATVNDAASDDIFDALADQTVTATITDDDTAGFTLSTTTLSTTEGSTTSFTIVLDAEPNSNVTIDISSDDTGAASLDLANVSFDNTNWNVAQTITVTGEQDNDLNDESATITATVNDAASDDNFDPLADQTVVASVTDDDTAGFTLSTTTVSTAEGSTTNFTIVLDAAPNSNVTIDVSSDDTGAARVDLASVSFDNTNWNVEQTITVSGEQDDDLNDETATITATINDAASDDIFDPLADQTVAATITDDDTADFLVTQTGGNSLTSESGSTDTFDVILNAQPNANVIINVTIGDATELTVDKTSLLFTNTNWDTPQTVTITGLDDDIDDGDVASTITLSIDASSDTSFTGLVDQTINVTNVDDDAPGITITPVSGLIVSESGTSSSFTIELQSSPMADVQINFTSDNTAEGTVSPTSFIFNSSNWNSPETITVTGVDDDLADGDIDFKIITAAAISTDPSYSGIDAVDVAVTNIDDDTAGFTLSTTSVSINEGSTTSFTVVLTAAPNSNVTIDLSSDDIAAASIDLSSVSFNNTDWNIPKTVTITGEQDDDLNNESVTITATINDSASDDSFDALADQTVNATITDDDAVSYTITETGGTSVTSESGSTDSFMVVLDAQPNTNVILNVAANDATELSVDKTSLVFTNSDWNIPQTVTITGLDDAVDDGDVASTITLSIDASSDASFTGLSDQTINVTNVDDDAPGITITPVSGLIVSESGTSSSFTIALQSSPISDVQINFSSDNTAEGTVSPTSFIFNSSNWNSPETITVTGVDDDLADGDIDFKIITAAAISTDPSYSGVDAIDVAVTNTDDDIAGFTLDKTSIVVSEDGNTSVTIVLNSEPASDVIIDIESSSTILSIDITSLTFDQTNWNSNQTIVVSAGETGVQENLSEFLTFSINPSSDPNYTALTDKIIPVEVISINDQPVITAQVALSTNKETDLTIELADLTVTDPDNNYPSDFTLTVNAGTDYSVSGTTITPDLGFNGTLTVPITVNDGALSSPIYNLEVVVEGTNNSPEAIADNYDVALGQVLIGNVLENDLDKDSDPLSVVEFSSNSDQMEYSILENGDFTFKSINFIGTHTQNYTVCDDGSPSLCTEGTITITVFGADFDQDGIPDEVEVVFGDTDEDGTLDYQDTDSDNDGILDEIEAGTDPLNPPDTDNDGIADYRDSDSDDDGKSDEEEGLEDCDNDGIPNYIDNNDLCDMLLAAEGFSPNGDGINDTWIIDGITQFPENSVLIFNRWGGKIKEIENYDNDVRVWYGENQAGRNVPDATYFYVIKIRGTQIGALNSIVNKKINGFIVVSR